MFIEFKTTPESVISINVDRVQTIKASIRTDGYTMLRFRRGDDEDYIEVDEPYESVMAKVNK